MKADATKSGGTSQDVQRRSHVATFAKVSDGRKQPIRGLWIRGERYYARLKVEIQSLALRDPARALD